MYVIPYERYVFYIDNMKIPFNSIIIIDFHTNLYNIK